MEMDGNFKNTGSVFSWSVLLSLVWFKDGLFLLRKSHNILHVSVQQKVITF